MLVIIKRQRDQFNSPVIGMNNPIASTCLTSEATKYEYVTELKGSFLGWFHPKALGRFMERYKHTLFATRNHQLIFDWQ
jgi:hypothetical protein